MAERDPHLDQLAHMTLDADTLEEKVFLMQVFYERLIIPRFRMIARSSRGTILEDLCNRLTIDDGIHHGAGMAYERVLLEGAGRDVQTTLIDAANRMLPIFTQHALWRPKAREFIGALMRETDIRMLKEDLEQGVRLAKSLGIDVSDIELPPTCTRRLRLLQDEALAAAERQHVLDERSLRAERELVAGSRRVVELDAPRRDHRAVAPKLVLVVARRRHRGSVPTGWAV